MQELKTQRNFITCATSHKKGKVQRTPTEIIGGFDMLFLRQYLLKTLRKTNHHRGQDT